MMKPRCEIIGCWIVERMDDPIIKDGRIVLREYFIIPVEEAPELSELVIKLNEQRRAAIYDTYISSGC
jgi:hypothetical protein